MSDEKSFSVCQEMLPLFRAVLISGIEIEENEILVSSTYMFTSELFKDRCRSFMYTKRRGPKHEP